MCSVMAIAGVAKGLLGAGSTLRSGSVAAGDMRFQAGVDLQNVELSELEEQTITTQAGLDKGTVGAAAEQASGEGKSRAAGGNVLLSEGSALEYDKALYEQSARSKQLIEDKKNLEVFAKDVEQVSLKDSAKRGRKGAKSLMRSSRLGAAASFFGSSSSGAIQGQASKARRT